ncbi:hypothetical protein [Flavobacterium ajazii]|uniref:hypothetical protein n=1 Tax=Flavobacterium ajazii TaxID=2692318 RepID=UPI0013D5C886|nr:hypothetical protein [Flavobacterium ajazii]
MQSFWKYFKAQSSKTLDTILPSKHILIKISTVDNYCINDWENWKEIYPEIDLLLSLNKYKNQTFIRTFQSFEHENKWLGFGRMKWNLENNIKWTEKHKTQKQLNFYNTEIWCPDWNHYEKTGTYPDVYINAFQFPDETGLLFAIKKTFYNKNKEVIDTILSNVGSKIPNSSLKSTERFWKKSYKNDISDLNHHDLKELFFKA